MDDRVDPQERKAADVLLAIDQEIDKGLDWLQRECFCVDYATIGRGDGGIATVVNYETAIHALLFIRRVLGRAHCDHCWYQSGTVVTGGQFVPSTGPLRCLKCGDVLPLPG
jgi:hypothetical protein